jgi:CDP-glucose 4,6-dehydratase
MEVSPRCLESLVIMENINEYQGKKVFVTGHTGFKGSWLISFLKKIGAEIKGYSLSPYTFPSLYSEIESELGINSIIADINDADLLKKEILDFQPDYIFHLAAQPLVRKSYLEPLETYQANIIGTANVLNAVRYLKKSCAVILITTDKVYDNVEKNYLYVESDNLGGFDPYSSSKACAELVINSYRQSFFNLENYDNHQKAFVSVRAGNVIGGGDWSTDRLVPDIIKAIEKNRPVEIRNPNAIRPWQHVMEPVLGYLKLGILLTKEPYFYSGAWNFGPENVGNLPVIEIVNKAISIYGSGEYLIKGNSNEPHEANLLQLNISKAKDLLKWTPKLDSTKAIDLTVNWYKSFFQRSNTAYELVSDDINYYLSLFKNGKSL